MVEVEPYEMVLRIFWFAFYVTLVCGTMFISLSWPPLALPFVPAPATVTATETVTRISKRTKQATRSRKPFK